METASGLDQSISLDGILSGPAKPTRPENTDVTGMHHDVPAQCWNGLF